MGVSNDSAEKWTFTGGAQVLRAIPRSNIDAELFRNKFHDMWWQDLVPGSQSHPGQFFPIRFTPPHECRHRHPGPQGQFRFRHCFHKIIYNKHRSPRRGTGFASDTKTLTEGGLCPESITSLPYREGLGLGGCFFASFFAPKKVRNIVKEHAAP